QGLLKGIGVPSTTHTVNTPTSKTPSSFDTGGYTGKFKGGKLAILHEKELILKPNDTSNMLEAVGLVRSIADKLPKLSGNNSNNSPNIEINPTFSYVVQGQFDERLAKRYSDYTMKDMKNIMQSLGVQFR